MLSARWEPRNLWSEMNRVRNELDRLFGTNGGRRFGASGTSVYPALNLWEDEQNLFVEAELPGFDLKNLEITVTGNTQLSLKGERMQPELPTGVWHRQERGYGGFSRTIELPEHVDADNVSAEFKHGVLTVKLPKKAEVKPRRIEVKSL